MLLYKGGAGLVHDSTVTIPILKTSLLKTGKKERRKLERLTEIGKKDW